MDSMFVYHLSQPVVGRIIISGITYTPYPQKLWMCYVTWQRIIKVVEGIKVADQMTL